MTQLIVGTHNFPSGVQPALTKYSIEGNKNCNGSYKDFTMTLSDI